MKSELSQTRSRQSALVHDIGKVEFREIRPDELTSLVDIEGVNLPLFMRTKVLILARIDRQFVGVCGIRGVMNTLSTEVSEKFQGQGIGNELMTRVTNIARKRGEKLILSTAYTTNYRSLKLTQKFGFLNVFVFTGNEVDEMMTILPLSRLGWSAVVFLRLFRRASPRTLGLFYAVVQRLVSKT